MRTLLKKNPKYSKRINYDALKDLFEGDSADTSILRTDGRGGDMDIEEKEDYMWRLDDNEKSDGEGALSVGGGAVVVEEGGGGVGQVGGERKSGNGDVEEHPGDISAGETLGDDDAYGEDDLDEKEDGGYGWDEGYEQEV